MATADDKVGMNISSTTAAL